MCRRAGKGEEEARYGKLRAAGEIKASEPSGTTKIARRETPSRARVEKSSEPRPDHSWREQRLRHATRRNFSTIAKQCSPSRRRMTSPRIVPRSRTTRTGNLNLSSGDSCQTSAPPPSTSIPARPLTQVKDGRSTSPPRHETGGTRRPRMGNSRVFRPHSPWAEVESRARLSQNEPRSYMSTN